ncbi:MAG: glycosyltransferase [Kiritimatiellia bacterium]
MAKQLLKWIRILLLFATPLAIVWATWWYDILDMQWIGGRLSLPMQGLFKVLLLADLGYLSFLLVRDWCFYRETPPVPDGALPRIAVVMPAYNEGEGVVRTLGSLLASNYPPEKMEIVAVDDGSADDTWGCIERVAAGSNGRIKAIRRACNGGKKRALADGIRASKGEIVVTVDSDTFFRPRTLRRLVSPFVGNEAIGSVAGNIHVVHEQQKLIPCMLAAIFTCNFDVLRAGQSSCRAVICTPGALSAYRRKLIEPRLEEWLGQKFLGSPSTIGEDRALAALVLRQDKGVVFQRSAVGYTNVPESYQGLCRMLLRWLRSDIRENLMLTDYLFSRGALLDGRMFCLRVTWLLSVLGMGLSSVSLLLLGYCLVTSHGLFLIVLFGAALLRGSIQAFINLAYRNERTAIYSYVFSVFALLSLFWLPTYALFTLHNSKWLTRQKPNAAGKE